MQKSIRGEIPSAKTPAGDAVRVPPEHWQDLKERNLSRICENTGAKKDPSGGLLLPFMKEYILVDRNGRSLLRRAHGGWERIDHPLLELLCLVYLLHAGPQGLARDMVSAQELKSGHFFKGPHELQTRPLVERFGYDLEGFVRASESLGGEKLDLADGAYGFWAFPKVPLYYLFWRGDQEFQPSLSILFDRSIENHLPPDAIWGLAGLVSTMLLKGKNKESM
jgi:hypothetical protein